MMKIKQYFFSMVVNPMSKMFYSMKLIILLIFLLTNLTIRANGLSDTTTYLLREESPRDSIKQIIDGVNEWSQVLSYADSFIGNPDSTYDAMDDPKSIGLDQKWIKRYSATDGRILSGPLGARWSEIVKVLDYINFQTSGYGPAYQVNVYLVMVSGIPTRQKTEVRTFSHDDLLKGVNLSNINIETSIQWGLTSSKILEEVSKELRGNTTESIIILFNSFQYYKSPFESSLATISIPSVHFVGRRLNEDKEERNRIKASFAGKKTMTGVVKSICASIEREFVGASEYLIGASSEEEKVEITSEKNTPLCKPINDLINETWTNNGEKVWYDLAVVQAATLYQNHVPAQRIHPNVIVDQTEKFNGYRVAEDMLGPDYQYITEILLDKLNLLTKRSAHTLDFLFVRVGFVIPASLRAKFAQDVYDKIPAAARGNKVIIVVPYYSCTENPDNFNKTAEGKSVGQPKRIFPFLFMPAAAFGSEPALARNMSEAFASETSFETGFESAFKHVPKEYTVYVGQILLNGTIIINDPVQLKGYVTGYSNFVDVSILVDERLTMIRDKGYLQDCQKKFEALAAAGARVDIFEWRADCFATNRAGIRKILREHPNPEFKEFGDALCNLKQSELVKPEAFMLANLYITGAIGKYYKKFLGGNFEEKQMDNEFFYEGKNNLYEKNPLLSAIDAGSLLLGFVGLDFIPDAVGALTAYAFGDHEAAAEFTKSIVITGAVMGALYKGAKASIASKEMVEAIAKGKGSLVPIGNEMVLVSEDIASLFAKGDLFARMGLPDKVSLVAKADPEINQVLLNGLLTGEKNALTKSPDFDFILKGLQDPNAIDLFKEARKADPKLSLIDFLKKVDLDPIKSILSKASKYGHDKDFLAFFEKELRKADKKTLDALNSSPDLIDEFYHYQMWNDGKGLHDFFSERKLLEGLPEPSVKPFKAEPGISLAALGNDRAILQAVGRIKHEPGWFDVIVHGADDGYSFKVLHYDGKEYGWVNLDHRQLYVWLRKQPGFLEAMRKGNGIRVLSCSAAKKDLVVNLGRKARARTKGANVNIQIEPDGSVAAVPGEIGGHWSEFDKNNWSISFEKQAGGVPEANKIPMGTKDDGAVSLGFFDNKVGNVISNELKIATRDFLAKKTDDIIKKVVINKQDDSHFLKDVFFSDAPTDQLIRSSKRDYKTPLKNTKVDRSSLPEHAKYKDVVYFSEVEKLQYEAKIKNGQWFVNGKLPSEDKVYIFVMDGKGNIYLGEGIQGKIHHTSFIGGNDAVLAGTMDFKDGKLISMDNISGHYLPGGSDLEIGVSEFLREMGHRGVDVKGIKYNTFDDAAGTAGNLVKEATLSDELVTAFKKSNPDLLILQMVEGALKNNDTKLLNDLLLPKITKPGVDGGPSGNKYSANLQNIKDDLDISLGDAYFKVSRADRPKYELKVKEGQLYNQGVRLDEGQKYLYVMDGNGNIYVGPDSDDLPSGFYHSSFLPGEKIVASGTLKVDGGRIILSNDSGHFEPTGTDILSVVRELTTRGIDVKVFEHMIVTPRKIRAPHEILSLEVRLAIRPNPKNDLDNVHSQYMQQLDDLQRRIRPRRYTILPINEEAMLLHFADKGKYQLNKALKSGMVPAFNKEPMTNMNLAQKILVNDALTRLPKYNGGIIYRGAGKTESRAITTTLDNGATVIEFDEFLFASKSEDNAIKSLNSVEDPGGNLVYQIKSKSAVDISDITHPSKASEELVSPTNTKYRVVGRVEKKLPDNRVIDYVYLEEL